MSSSGEMKMSLNEITYSISIFAVIMGQNRSHSRVEDVSEA